VDVTMPDMLTCDECIKILPELKGTDIEITVLKGGITNALYRVKVTDDMDYVFRIYGEKTELFIDRDAEAEIMRLVEPLHISPKLVKYLPREDITIIEFIEGYTLKNEDFLNEDLWENIIRPIRILHGCGKATLRVFDPITEIKYMRKILSGLNVSYPEFKIDDTVGILERISVTADVQKSDYVLCHNDLLADNFMLTEEKGRYGEPMYLIDFEYAGMSCIWYDLADMLQEILVPPAVERSLLNMYWEGKKEDFNMYMIDLFKPFPDIYWFLWSLIQLNISSLEFDYYNYGRVKYENARKNIDRLREIHNLKI
jgi:thiamine kinase-like enzyme